MKIKNFGYTILTLFITASWVYMLSPHQQVEATAPQTVPVFQVSPQIFELTDPIGIPRENLVAAKAQIHECHIDGLDSSITVHACYDVANHILYIPNATITGDTTRARSAVAHEYLHWAWDQRRDKSQLCASLMTYYNAPNHLGAALRDRMLAYKPLEPGTLTFCDELHSILGTEAADREMGSSLVQYYQQYLPNRNALPSYF